MPRNPTAIKSRVKDARAYELAMKRTYTDPMFRRLRARLAIAEASNQAFHAMDVVVEEMKALPNFGVPTHEIQKNLDRMNGYNRTRTIKTFRAALGVNVSKFLTEPAVAEFMKQNLSNNVDLIKTIPARAHDGLKARLQKELAEAPFDQQRLKILLKKEYKSTGYNLRRLTRDQTSKTNAGLTQIRQSQLGVEEYQWITSQDGRVRPTHIANSGVIFNWANPPSDTGHPGEDIQCRCRAAPIVTKAARRRLGADGPYSLLPEPPRPPRPLPPSPPVSRPFTKKGVAENHTAKGLQSQEKTFEQHENIPGYRPAEDLSSATQSYIGQDYKKINKALRDHDFSDKLVRKQINDIGKDALPLADDMVAYRGTRTYGFDFSGNINGNYIEDGFMSTATDWTNAMDFKRKNDSTLFQIRVRKGTRAIVTNTREAEVILMEGQKFRIVDVIEDVKWGDLDDGQYNEFLEVDRVVVLETIP